MRFPLLAIFLLTLPTIGVCAPSDYLFESEGAGLEIESSPSGADVYVNGVRRGKTPLVLDNVVPGAARLVLEKDGYWPRRTAVVVPEGKRITVRLKLEEARGIIRVEKPEGNGIADPAVLIDGERASLGDNEVLEGRHSVRLQAFGFEDETRTVFVGRGEREIVQVALRPARFTLAAVRFSRGRFNPANPGLLGSTTLSFTVNAPGAASVSISDRTGNEAFSAELPAMDTWEQSIAWTGRSSEGEPLADGLYTAAVTARSADGRTAATEKTAVVIDSAAVIRPASLHGDAGGLLFAPEARTLPAGSFQVEAAALFGKPFGSGAFDAPPFSLGIRFSPLEGTEAVAALRVEPARDDGGVVSFGASGKRALIPQSRGLPVALSASFRWSYSRNAEPSSFGAEPGIEAALPLDAILGAVGSATVYAHAAPALAWNGAEGIPDGPAPEAMLGAGLSLAGREYTAALSAKFHASGYAMAGAEAHFFPPPSVLVITAAAGAWRDDGNGGFFGGAALGILY